MKKQILQTALLLAGLVPACLLAFEVPHAATAPLVDGDPSDSAWARAEWVDIDKLVLGEQPEKHDFSGRYKLVWTKDHLYLLAEIQDDVLHDSHPNPLDSYWEDDTLEIFIDEDASGGDHLYSYNAFAYHIALDNQAADIGPFLSEADRQAEKSNRRLFPQHVHAAWKRSVERPEVIYWEVQLSVYGDNYQDNHAGIQEPVALSAGKRMGFMVAYCDADYGTSREHFIGDVEIEPVDGDRNRGYIDAGVFGPILLVD